MEIRDPIHGAIVVDREELAIVDHPFVQRLRGVRQLGFSHLPFPGATHSRYAHSLGALHLAGQAFDASFRDEPLADARRRRAFRRCVRLAGLCHDLGHAPFSHAAEFAMPPLRELGIGVYRADRVQSRLDSRASHEDYTVALLTKSGLGEEIARRFDFGPAHVAALVSSDVQVPDDFFVHGGLDYRGILSQLISSDLDVDRLDYLVRDSFYSGARYGQIDTPWLITNLTRHVEESGLVVLGLDGRATYAFDDYMVARLHMFMMVYFHQKSVAYEEMLQRVMQDPGCDYRLPADPEAYARTDDADLWTWLRRSEHPFAQAIARYDPWRVAIEAHGRPHEVDLSHEEKVLSEAGIDTLSASATGAVFAGRKPGKPQIYVIDRPRGGRQRAVPLYEATEIFRRYQDERSVARLYVAPEHRDRARELLNAAGPGPLFRR